jgi:hypothetical protein
MTYIDSTAHYTHVAEEGPRSGFCRSGWKEKRPRKRATHLASRRAGQLLAYMVTTKTVMLATKMTGTSQGTQSRSPSCCGYSGDGTLPGSFLAGPPFSTSARVAMPPQWLCLCLVLRLAGAVLLLPAWGWWS